MPSIRRHAGHPETPLVARHVEIATLRSHLDALIQGQGSAVLAVGDAGVGKSALLRSVFGATDRDHQLIWAAGDELSQVFPLLPFVEAVHGTFRARMSAILRGGEGMTDPALVASEAMVEWLDDLCVSSPVVLVFEDLHWADAASVRLWNRLARSAEQLPLLMVGSMRPASDRADLAALTRQITELATVQQGVMVDLAPLSQDETSELVTSMLGGPPSRRLIEIVDAAGGNPLYVKELIDALTGDELLFLGSDGVVEAVSGSHAASLSSVISARFDSVPPEVRDLLRLAALLGVDFNVADLAAASGQPMAELVGMLGQARSAGVLETSDTGMTFRHPLIRDVLCEQVADSVRAAWHQEVGRALAQVGRPALAVARQLLAAIELDGGLPASDWLIQWLTVEGEGLANQSASVVKTLFTHALYLLPLGDPRRVAIAVPLTDALLRAYDLAEAERLAQQTLDIVTAQHAEADADAALKLALVIVDSSILLSRPDDALNVLDRIESEMDWNRWQKLRLQVMRSWLYTYTGQPEEAEALAKDALITAPRLGDQWSRGMAYHSLCALEFRGSVAAGALHFADSGLAAVDQAADSLGLRTTLLADRAMALLQLHSWEDVRSTVAQLRQLAERTGNGRTLVQCTRIDVRRMFNTGEWDDLLSEMDAANEELDLLFCYVSAAIVSLHRDDTTSFRRYLSVVEKIMAKSRRMPNDRGRTDWVPVVLALEMEHSGDIQGALNIQLQAMEDEWSVATGPTAHVVELAVACGRRDDAEKAVAFAEDSAAHAMRGGLIPHCRGLLDRDPGQLATAARFYADQGLALLTAQTLQAEGLVWAERGDNSKARRAMTESLDIYTSLGAAWDIQRVRATFRRYGMRTGSREARNRPTSGWQSLTATETKIAHQVAQGLSNRLIAEQLFLSRRTVDTHVSHILAKLGLRSRVEVAKMALSAGI